MGLSRRDKGMLRLRIHGGNVMCLMSGGANRRPVIRRYVFDALRLVSTGVIADTGECRFLVGTRDDMIGRATFFRERPYELERAERALRLANMAIGRNVVKDQVFIDVGANIGTTTVPAAVNWGARRVLAIEPEPSNFDLLRCNVILNHLDGIVDCVNSAVSSAKGDAVLELAPANSGDHRIRRNLTDGSFGEMNRDRIVVPTLPLDAICDDASIGPKEVGVVWVDVQGHEGHVLSSATSLLNAGVPFIIEYWPYGLNRADGLELVNEMVGAHFSTVIDVASQHQMKACDVARLAAIYPADTSAQTDLVLVP